MKIALVHDYLTQRGGAERVFELLCRHYPDADIFTSLYDPDRTIELGDRLVKTTILQSVPGASKYFRLMAPFYYPAFRMLDLQDYDLIISSSTSFAKCVRKRPDATHICFCHNVTRFLWDTQTYLREYSDFQNFYPFLEKIFRVMRAQDLKYAQEPDLYIANSSTVAQRIRKIYKKQAIVINYPIDTSQFEFSDHKEDYYLASARCISYKRLDIIVEAFNWLGWPLKITGDGPQLAQLKTQAMGNIELLGHVSDGERKTLMRHAKSVVIAALEDYGLVPIEANASGTPVISYGAGGVLDTQIPSKTGVFFRRQTPESLQSALLSAQNMEWDYAAIRDHAISHFSEATFFQQVTKLTDQLATDPRKTGKSSIGVDRSAPIDFMEYLQKS
jgi:glycosyltransferase involved in cell wall biosynthesis